VNLGNIGTMKLLFTVLQAVTTETDIDETKTEQKKQEQIEIN
jgi:hypothetical protein